MPSRKNSKRLRNSRRKMRGGQAATTTANINPTTLIQPAMAYVNTLDTQTQTDLFISISNKRRSLTTTQITAWDNITRQLFTYQSANTLSQQLAYNMIADRIVLGTPIPSAGTTTSPVGTTTSPVGTTTSPPINVTELIKQAFAKTVTMPLQNIMNEMNTITNKFNNATSAQKTQINYLLSQVTNTNTATDLAKNKVVQQMIFGIPI